MLRFYINSTLRLIAKNKALSIIKAVGLAIGVMTFLLSALFSLHELNFDRQHHNADRLFRYVHRINTPEGIQSFAVTSATVGPALKERFPEVEAFNRILVTPVSVRNPLNNVSFNEIRFGFADANFLDLFNFPLVHDAAGKDILTEPYSLIITPSTALKYFGREDPIGKTLIVDGSMDCVIKGVFGSDMKHSHFDFDFVAAFSTLEAIKGITPLAAQIPASRLLEEKGYNSFQTYLLLAKDAKAETLQAKFPAFIEAFRGAGKSKRLKPILQSVESIHLNSNLLNEIGQNGSIQSVYIFFTIGLLILLIACVNYVNLSTAEFVNRAKGISLKKILGVTRTSLLTGHLVETALLTVLSLALGSVLAYLFLPVVSLLINRKIEIPWSGLFLILNSIFCFIILVAGIYPAYSISRVGTLDALKGSPNLSKSPLSLRNTLVFFQILVSFCLVSVSVLIYDQITFLLKKDMGFNANQVIVINAGSMSPQNRIRYKNSLQGAKGILAVGGCTTPPGGNMASLGITLPEQSGDDERRTLVYQSYVDEDYARALGVSLDEGRFYNTSSPSDSIQYLILNQTAAKIIKGSSANSLNAVIELPGSKIKKTVIGVVNDFNFASLHNQIEPMLLEYNPNQISFFLVRFESKSADGLIPLLGSKWKELDAELPFDYYFLDQGFARLYQDDQKQKLILSYFSVLAILIASLGIFGTTLFSIQQKTREVGIRKILGSENGRLFTLLFRPVFYLVCVACILGAPISYLVGSKWLDQYAYRIIFNPMILLLAFGTILLAVLCSVAYHFQKLARINPVEVLRQN